jgi:nitronate monooxygenase
MIGAPPTRGGHVLNTAFTELVGCTVPIQQAPMGQIAPPALASAVAGAGGVGTVGAPIGGTPDDVAAVLDALDSLGKPGVCAVNFVGAAIDPAAVAVAAPRVRIVDFFWHDPDPALVAAAHDGGALVNWQVGSLPDALLATGAGADMVTVQGTEAGGHVRGASPLLPLLASVLEAVDVPVLAAGGIADPRTLAAVLAAGAAGARLGTRFIATEESGAHPEYVMALLASGPDSTEITDGFAICPLCETLARCRVLTSALVAVAGLPGEHVGAMVTADHQIPLPVRAGLPPHREVRGEIRAMALYAGQAVHLVNTVEPAAALVRRLAEGAESLLRAW